jgi:hypothetical protein
VNGDPPALVGVQVCGGVVTAGVSVQPAEPPVPAKIKLMSRITPGITSKAMKGVSANDVPTGCVVIFRSSMVFCPSSPENEPVPPDRVNICASFGSKSLCHVKVVGVAVTIPLKLKAPVIGAAGRLTAVKPADRHTYNVYFLTVI